VDAEADAVLAQADAALAAALAAQTQSSDPHR
jgi:hypothetical protein